MEFFYCVNRQLLRIILRSYFRISVQGVDHIPSTGAVLLAANHCSYLDPPLIAIETSRQITFLAKEEIFSLPICRWWLHHVGVHPVARNRGDARAVLSALRLLRQEKALLVFPEGTRTFDGELQPLEVGVAWLSIKSGVPVVPLYLSGTFRAFPRKAWFPRPVRLKMGFGPPINPEKIAPESDLRERATAFNERLRGELVRLKIMLEEKNVIETPSERLNTP